MNLVRLGFIAGMIGLAAFSIQAAVNQPFHEPVFQLVQVSANGGQAFQCKWDGGYDRAWFIVAAVFAIIGASAVALTDLVRRVY